jgi:3-dehydroquinate synthase
MLEAMKKANKRVGGKNCPILLKKLGSAYIDETVTDEEILDALRFIRYEE